MKDLKINTIYQGNSLAVLKTFPAQSVDCCITSPPYWGLRDYGTATWVGGDENCNHYRDNHVSNSCTTGHTNSQKEGGIGDSIYKDVCKKCGAIRQDEQLGLENTPEEYVANMVAIFSEVNRILKDEGTLWLNLGDSYYNFRGYSDFSIKQTCASNDAHVMNSPSGKRNVIQENLKGKDMVGIPWMTAFALRSSGWYLRQDIIWHKPNPMPESVTDRCTKSHEYIFLLSKSPKYYFDYESIQEEATGYDGRKYTVMKGSEKYSDGEYLQMGNANSLSVKGRERWKYKSKFGDRDGELNGLHSGNEWTPKYKNLQDKGQQPNSFHESRAEGIPDELYAIRNKRDVWTINTKPYKEAHFATFPEKLIEPMIKAGCPPKGLILDPFMGSGTIGLVARKLDRNYVGIELNPKYIKIAEKRIFNEIGLFL